MGKESSMGKVYAPPFDPPAIDYVGDWQKQEKEYMDLLKEWCNENGSGKYKGDTVQFPVADSYAVYMIMSLKPLEMIHVPLGDAWHYQYIERLTSADVKKEADGLRQMNKIFGGR
jgi:hypothetical protein